MTTAHPDDVTLNDYLDGALPAAQQRQVELHMASCAKCRETVDSLRHLQTAVRQLPPLEPPRDGWTRLERTLRSSARVHQASWWQWVGVAAALTIALLGGMKLADFRRSDPAAPSVARTSDAPTAQSVEAELQQAEQHYQNAITGLERIANSETSSLDPQIAATLEKNLAVVDQAISESRAALKSRPTSEPAQESLLESFKAKIALLQDTIALVNEMRRGPSPNPDTRGVASGLK